MTDPVPEIKQAPSNATYARSTVSAGNAAGTPVIAGIVFGYVFRALHAIWPIIEPPTEVECMYMGLGVSGLLAWWASFSMRGTQIKDP